MNMKKLLFATFCAAGMVMSASEGMFGSKYRPKRSSAFESKIKTYSEEKISAEDYLMQTIKKLSPGRMAQTDVPIRIDAQQVAGVANVLKKFLKEYTCFPGVADALDRVCGDMSDYETELNDFLTRISTNDEGDRLEAELQNVGLRPGELRLIQAYLKGSSADFQNVASFNRSAAARRFGDLAERDAREREREHAEATARLEQAQRWGEGVDRTSLRRPAAPVTRPTPPSAAVTGPTSTPEGTESSVPGVPNLMEGL